MSDVSKVEQSSSAEGAGTMSVNSYQFYCALHDKYHRCRVNCHDKSPACGILPLAYYIYQDKRYPLDNLPLLKIERDHTRSDRV